MTAATYVLVHGGWAGGWQFKQIEHHLRKAGHTVYRPSLTGHAERVHLASPEVGLDTHIDDILNLFKYEELDDVILLGYSYSGMVITGVAEAIPQHIRHLVYLDAFIPKDGQSLGDLVGPEVMQHLQQAVDAHGDGWRIPPDPTHMPLSNDHLSKTGMQPVTINNPQAAALPRTFIHCTVEQAEPDPILNPIIAQAQVVKSDPAWRYHEIDAVHGDVWETHPKEVNDILLALA